MLLCIPTLEKPSSGHVDGVHSVQQMRHVHVHVHVLIDCAGERANDGMRALLRVMCVHM